MLTLKKLLRRKYFRGGCLYILPTSILLGIGWESLQSSCVLKCMLKDRWCLLCIGKEVFQVPLSKGGEQRTQPVSKDDCQGSIFNAGCPPFALCFCKRIALSNMLLSSTAHLLDRDSVLLILSCLITRSPDMVCYFLWNSVALLIGEWTLVSSSNFLLRALPITTARGSLLCSEDQLMHIDTRETGAAAPLQSLIDTFPISVL